MRSVWVAALLAAPAGVAAADLKSGPAVGGKVAALKVFAVTGAKSGQEVDYPAQRGEKPTVYLFVSAGHWDRPAARYLRAIDRGLPEASAQAEAVAVWLTEKPDEAKDYLPKLQQSLQFQTTALTVDTGEKGGPADWNINGEAAITAVVAHRGQVVATFAYRTVNEKDAGAAIEAVRKAVAGK
jgi:hypothetical protein